ncbi:MAG: cyclic nucleotide-binding domain-containing protein [archaeon]|nr:cyclic nucleotide-binding domain-containing protein [archaeon]
MENEIKIIPYSSNSTILVEDSINEGYFYILKSGTISIQSDIIFKDNTLNKYHSGDSFGLVSGLTKNPVRHTLTADSDCEVVRIPLKRLGEYLHNNRQICVKIISLYSNQLRALDSYLVNKYYSIDSLEHPEKLLDDSQSYIDINQKNIAAHSLCKYIEWATQNKINPRGIEFAEKKLKEIAPNFQPPIYDSNILNLKEDKVIFVENEPADNFYIIKEGAVKISKLVDGQEFILCILREGEIFGEMAVLNKKVRNATAIVFEDSKIMRLSLDTFMEEVGEKILSLLFEIFSRRIWYAHQRASLLVMNDFNSKMYCYLQILISDINAKNKFQMDSKGEFIFNFSLDDLKKMIGFAELKNETINEFLTDTNIDISNHSIRIFDKRKIDDKVSIYKTRERKKNVVNMPV